MQNFGGKGRGPGFAGWLSARCLTVPVVCPADAEAWAAMALLAGLWLGGSRGAEKPGVGGTGSIHSGGRLAGVVVVAVAALGVWSGAVFVMWRRMKGYTDKEGLRACGVPVLKKKQTVIHLPMAVSQLHEDS